MPGRRLLRFVTSLQPVYRARRWLPVGPLSVRSEHARASIDVQQTSAGRLQATGHHCAHAFEELEAERRISVAVLAQDCSVEEEGGGRLKRARRAIWRAWSESSRHVTARLRRAPLVLVKRLRHAGVAAKRAVRRES